MSWNPSGSGSALPGHVSRLPREIHERPKMAPSLHSALRAALEGKQVPVEDFDAFFPRQKSLLRYDFAFRILWAVCQLKGLDLLRASLHQIASRTVVDALLFRWHGQECVLCSFALSGIGSAAFLFSLGASEKAVEYFCAQVQCILVCD